MVDFHEAGGVPAVMNEIGQFLDVNCLTVSGKTVQENINGCNSQNREVIRPLDDPLWEEGAIRILRGNLAPRGAVIRHSIVRDRTLLKRDYTAKVFDFYEDAVNSIHTGNPKSIEPGDVVVARYEGPRGGPAMGEMLPIVTALSIAGKKDVAVITDGRFSGLTSDFPAIGHVCPEAQVGGVLAAVQDGDIIRLDVAEGNLELQVKDDEIKRRLDRWTPPAPKYTEGTLVVYSALALQADNGAGWETRVS